MPGPTPTSSSSTTTPPPPPHAPPSPFIIVSASKCHHIHPSLRERIQSSHVIPVLSQRNFRSPITRRKCVQHFLKSLKPGRKSTNTPRTTVRINMPFRLDSLQSNNQTLVVTHSPSIGSVALSVWPITLIRSILFPRRPLARRGPLGTRLGTIPHSAQGALCPLVLYNCTHSHI